MLVWAADRQASLNLGHAPPSCIRLLQTLGFDNQRDSSSEKIPRLEKKKNHKNY